MSESGEDEEVKELIQYTGNYGGIDQDSKFWDDYEEMGGQNGEDLLKYKITKIKIYTGTFNEKKAIMGISCVFKNLFSGKDEPQKDHKGSIQFEDVKEFDIQAGEYLTDFHIRFTNEAEYISQLGFGTSKGNKILVGTEEGEDKTIDSNGGQNFIVGTFGCVNKKLDAMGCLYVSKTEYLKRKLFCLFMLRHVIKKDTKFKEKWDAKWKELPEDFQYIWKAMNLPDAPFSHIIKYCYA
jgi:hypothetical protein